MTSIAIVYFSATRHTQQVAEAVADGAKSVAGTEVTLLRIVGEESSGSICSMDSMSLGCKIPLRQDKIIESEAKSDIAWQIRPAVSAHRFTKSQSESDLANVRQVNRGLPLQPNFSLRAW